MAAGSSSSPSQPSSTTRSARPVAPAQPALRGSSGRVVDDGWDGLELDPAATVAYLCGNPGMVASAQAALARHGMATADVHTESYWLERDAPAA